MKKQAKRRTAPKKLTAIQTSRHLHMSQHKHTGHLLPRRSTSYPMLAMIVLSVGVLLGGYTRYVTADSGSGDYTVHASVPGPVPTQAATIDTPAAGTAITTQPVSVGGSCPVNTYVSLYRNNFFSGVALCDASGQWSLSTGLFRGANNLQAKVYNYTDVAGPVSDTVTVYYNPPGSAGSSSKPSSAGNSTSAGTAGTTASALILKTNYLYQGVYTGDPLNWTLSIDGGQAPYSLDIDWGDGQRSLLSQSTGGDFTVSHTYKKAGGYRGSYQVKLVASDAAGNQTLLQLLAIVNNHPVVGGVTNLSGGNGLGAFSGSNIGNTLKYIWPTYGVVVLMLGSFWLGERQEFHYLKRRRGLRHS